MKGNDSSHLRNGTDEAGMSAMDADLDDGEGDMSAQEGEAIDDIDKPIVPKKSKKQRMLEKRANVNETEQRIKMLSRWKEKLKVLYKNMKQPVAVK